MKTLAVLLIALAVACGALAVFVTDLIAAGGGHDRDTSKRKLTYAAQHMNREQYIAFLLRTERHDNPELWQRIEAVKQLRTWPE